MPPKNDKKERLLKAAQSLIHRQGFHHTTLAAISEESGVSLGNMYYYFKTKEDILAAVTEGQTKRFHSYASDWEQDPLPRNRLLSFLQYSITVSNGIANHGCPVGSLSQELSKNGGGCLDEVQTPLKDQVDWATQQFLLLGEEDAKAMGKQFIANLQGACLLANALNDPAVLVEQVKRIQGWVDSL